MGLRDTITPSSMYAEETVDHLRTKRKLQRLQMEVDLCHLWLDAADIPRNESTSRGVKAKPKTLLQRLAIFCALYMNREDYDIWQENIDALIKDPSEDNMYLAPLQKRVSEDGDGDEIPE